MSNLFKKSDIKIVAPDGSVRHETKAIVQSELVVIADPKVHIMPGDEIRRLIPSGAEEVFEVLDPAYFEVGVGNMGAHYQVKVRRQGSYPKGSGGNYFNVSGPNARVNFQSQDSSQNIVSDRSVFGDLKAAVSGIKDQDTRESLLRLVSDMETKADDRGAFTKAYQAFITSAANHMTIIAPLLPALSSFLG